MVLQAAVPAAIGAGAIGTGAAAGGAGAAGAGGSSALLTMLSSALAGGLLNRGGGESPKETKRRTLADLYQKLLQQQQLEFLSRREQENLSAGRQANALQEMAAGFRASLTGR